MDGRDINELVGGHRGVQVLPPLVEEVCGDDPEPGRPQQAGVWRHHGLELRLRHVFVVPDLLGVWREVDVGDLDEEDVVELVLPPGRPGAVCHGVLRAVVQASQELEVFHGDLLGGDPELVLELPDRRGLDAWRRAVGDVLGAVDLGWAVAAEGVRAAGVCPDVRERDLVAGSLLEEQAVLGVEEEDGEGAVKEGRRGVLVELVAVVLVVLAYEIVVLVHQQALIPQHEVFLAPSAVPGPCGVLLGVHLLTSRARSEALSGVATRNSFPAQRLGQARSGEEGQQLAAVRKLGDEL